MEAFLDGRAVSAYQETAGEAVRRLLRRHWLPLVTAAAAAS